MKKIMILCSAVCMLLCGCSGGAESSVSEQVKETTIQTTTAVTTATEAATEAPAETQTEPATTTAAPNADMTCMEVAQTIADKVGGENVHEMSYEDIGAVDGASFLYKSETYEIYSYNDNASEYQDAQDGFITVSYLEDDFKVEAPCIISGKHIMIYGSFDEIFVDGNIQDSFLPQEIENAFLNIAL